MSLNCVLQPLDPGADLLSANELNVVSGIRHARSCVNTDANRSSSRGQM